MKYVRQLQQLAKSFCFPIVVLVRSLQLADLFLELLAPQLSHQLYKREEGGRRSRRSKRSKRRRRCTSVEETEMQL